MLPDNNPIVVRIEFVLPPPSHGNGGGGAEPPALPPHVQETADKVQVAAKDAPLNEGSGKIYPTIDPIRLNTPKDPKEGKKILERLVELLPIKLHQLVQQILPRKEKVETPIAHQNNTPAAKTTSTAKGEALSSDQRVVAEEIEGVARPQEDHRLERRRNTDPIAASKAENPKALPEQKGKAQEKGSVAPPDLTRWTVQKEEPTLPRQQELAKPLLKQGRTDKPESPQQPLQGERVQLNPPFAAAHPIQAPIFPQPLIVEPRPENRPQELPKERVEEIARVEGVQPVQRDPPFRLERNDPNGGIIPIHQDDRDIVRVPLSPDLPLNRQNLFKPAHQGGARWQEDEGHAIGDLIHMLLCAFICGAETPSDVWRYLEQRSALFQKWLHLKKGIPSYRLLAFIFARLTPHALDKLLEAITGQGEILHHLQRMRLWETDRGLLCVQSDKELHKGKPKEILSLFDVGGSVVQLDLPALDPSLAGLVRKHRGHYLHRVKPTDEPLYSQLTEGFSAKADYRDVREMNNRTELREITLQPAARIEANALFTDLSGAVRFNSEILAQSKLWLESRIYLTDLSADPEEFAHTLRTFAMPAWVEWMVDLDFTDWSCNYTERHCTKLKQFAWQLLEKQDRPLEARKQAQTDVRVLTAVIRGQGV